MAYGSEMMVISLLVPGKRVLEWAKVNHSIKLISNQLFEILVVYKNTNNDIYVCEYKIKEEDDKKKYILHGKCTMHYACEVVSN